MSKYLSFPEAAFKDKALLLAALADMGYMTIEQGEALPLYGYLDDQRPETAELVIRRGFVGQASNDIGFKRTAAGYVPIVSEFDQAAALGGRWVEKLRASYGAQVVRAVQRQLGGTMHSQQVGQTTKYVLSF